MKAVDLGLSVYWGENILITPNKHFEENLFTWGDDSYNNAHNKACKEDDYEELADNGIITDDGFLTPQYDHAYQILGNNWRMPTVDEFKELMDKCKWHWVGNGYVVTGPNKNSIKLPFEVSYRDTGQKVIEDIWYEGEVEKKVFSKEIKSFWSSEPSYDCIIDGLVNEAYVLSISNPESRLSIMISSRNRGKKNLIIPVTSDKSLLIGENHIPLTEHQSKKPWFVDMGDINLDGFQNAGYTAAPIVPSGQSEVLPQWRRLSNAIKGFLAENYGIEEINAYNDMLNAPALMEAVCHDLKCHGLM
jgi:hypothetical protein